MGFGVGVPIALISYAYTMVRGDLPASAHLEDRLAVKSTRQQRMGRLPDRVPVPAPRDTRVQGPGRDLIGEPAQIQRQLSEVAVTRTSA
ncbi:hypothetical protein ACFROC_31285 [Nocardia tengchongensis]|uniref:hypothetical protein n=1 Tax=Nocardia tengchongensis TaxID=2055889 RepID=UPI00369C8C30